MLSMTSKSGLQRMRAREGRSGAHRPSWDVTAGSSVKPENTVGGSDLSVGDEGEQGGAEKEVSFLLTNLAFSDWPG